MLSNLDRNPDLVVYFILLGLFCIHTFLVNPRPAVLLQRRSLISHSQYVASVILLYTLVSTAHGDTGERILRIKNAP